MSEPIIVRADFYPDGNIIPLWVTTLNKYSVIIKRILEIKSCIKQDGTTEYSFLCSTEQGVLKLIFSDNKWARINE